jgi:hypothetical protein
MLPSLALIVSRFKRKKHTDTQERKADSDVDAQEHKAKRARVDTSDQASIETSRHNLSTQAKTAACSSDRDKNVSPLARVSDDVFVACVPRMLSAIDLARCLCVSPRWMRLLSTPDVAISCLKEWLVYLQSGIDWLCQGDSLPLCPHCHCHCRRVPLESSSDSWACCFSPLRTLRWDSKGIWHSQSDRSLPLKRPALRVLASGVSATLLDVTQYVQRIHDAAAAAFQALAQSSGEGKNARFALPCKCWHVFVLLTLYVATCTCQCSTTDTVGGLGVQQTHVHVHVRSLLRICVRVTIRIIDEPSR